MSNPTQILPEDVGLRTAARWLPLLVLILFPWLEGCATPARLAAVPRDQERAAHLRGMTDVRYWQEEDLALLTADAEESLAREQAAFAREGHTGPLGPAAFLAVSGGGDDGAFGAGLLVGWSEAGTRPQFKVVTGISTGALTAPFAFLGSRYDPQLQEVYTTISRADIMKDRNKLAALFDDAMADTAPLKRLVARYITAAVIEAIAVEHARGRILLIGTTNLDARRPVIWNLTKIAASGSPDALELVRSLLVASASIPGAFPPVLIDVDVNGQPFQEMHVDGGASAQVFVYPPKLKIAELSEQQRLVRERKAYIIRNSRIDPDWADTRRATLSIAARAVTSLIHSQGVGDLYRIYSVSQRDNVDFNLAFIPSTFNVPAPEPFDRHYMNELFKVGREFGKSGAAWQKLPPGY